MAKTKALISCAVAQVICVFVFSYANRFFFLGGGVHAKAHIIIFLAMIYVCCTFIKEKIMPFVK